MTATAGNRLVKRRSGRILRSGLSMTVANVLVAIAVASAIHLSTPADLTLVRPLGTRVVIDAVTGRPRDLGVRAF